MADSSADDPSADDPAAGGPASDSRRSARGTFSVAGHRRGLHCAASPLAHPPTRDNSQQFYEQFRATMGFTAVVTHSVVVTALTIFLTRARALGRS